MNAKETVAYVDRVVRSYLVPVFLGDIRGPHSEVVDGATAFLFKPADQALLVTAAHVYEKAQNLGGGNVRSRTGVGSCRIALASRLIDVDADLDLATFRVEADEVDALGSQLVPVGLTGWPPPPPTAGDAAILAGFPGNQRLRDPDGGFDLGVYTAHLRINEVGPRHLTFLIDYTGLDDYSGQGMPEQGYSLGGVSGGPVLLLVPGAVLTWRLCGVLGQQAPLSIGDVIQAGRADFILPSGKIK
jgi:hypothetical protein